MKYSFTIEKIGRKWAQIIVHGKHDYKAKTLMTNVTGCEIGETVEREGRIDDHANRFGRDFELVCVTEAEIKAAEDKKRNDEIQRWLGYFRNHVSENYFYERAVREIHALGCHNYDDEFENAQREIAARKEAARIERARKRAEEDAKYTRLAIAAYDGFYGRPDRGQIIHRDGRVYKVVSSYYHDADGWSFGAMNEEWYEVKCEDITDTARGQKIAAEKAAADEAAQAEREKRAAKAEALKNVEEAIKAGERYTGEPVNVSGNDVLDTTNIHGGGERITVTEDGYIWLIINNSADGDDWSINNINGSAYGYRRNIDDVYDLLNAYLSIDCDDVKIV